MEIAPDELTPFDERLEREDLTVMAYHSRETGSAEPSGSPLLAALGDRFVARVLPESAASRETPPFFETVVASPHSVPDAHLIDQAGQPTIAARDEILSFFADRPAS